MRRWQLLSSFFKQLWHYKSLFIGPLIVFLSIKMSWFVSIDRLYYDFLVKKAPLPPADNILAITIDDASLMKIGSWPWPRSIHAELIKQLTKASPKAIVFDVLFSEPTLEQEDQQLIEAVKHSGKVYLPIYISTLAYQKQLVERLPLPLLSENAAGLGHIHYVIDSDGISRSVFLKEGLKEAFWPHIALAVKQRITPGFSVPGIRPDFEEKGLPIQRDYLNLLPFLPAENIPSVSYIEVLAGLVPDEVLKNKVIFIGASAAGLGDFVITPTSGLEKRVPGVLFNASAFHALDKDLFIKPMPQNQIMTISLLVSVLALLLGVWLAGIPLFLNCVFIAAALIFTSTYLFLFQHIWLPPMAGVIATLMAYPVWSLLKTGQAMHFLQQELRRLEFSAPELSSYTEKDLYKTLDAVQQQGFIKSWQVGEEAERLYRSNFLSVELQYKVLTINEKSIALIWQSELPENDIRKYMQALLAKFDRPEKEAHYSWEIISATIAKIKSANKTAQSFYDFAQQSLAKLHTPLIISERSGRVLFINQAAVDLFKVSVGFIQYLLNEKTDFSEADSNQFLNDLLLYGKSQERELQTIDGQNFILNADMDSFEEVGEVALFVFVNITHLRALEKSRSEALHLLSHDLRSPLVSALAVIEKSDDKNKAAFVDIKAHISRSLNYAEDFLNVAKAESLQQEQFYECDIHALVEQAIAQITPQLKIKKQTLDFDYSEHDFWVSGNPDLLERMIVNLLSNANKYSNTNTKITVSLELDENTLILRIQDQGIGMDEQGLNQLFDSFYRGDGKSVNQQGGIGLGMRLVATVIDRHQGSIEVESEPGKGTLFSIYLPAVAVD